MTSQLIRRSLPILLICLGTSGYASAEQVISPTWNMWMFSRANCINNETISFEYALNEYWQMEIMSSHFNFEAGEGSPSELFFFEPSTVTYRAAAVNWGGGLFGYWEVLGWHGLGPAWGTILDEAYQLIGQNCPHDNFSWSFTGGGHEIHYVGQCKVTYTDSCW
ncbi:hypothetical protein [Thauera sp. Sel9]|uniref:hypothetical protein n=1 Tax=Thauera sp. Sel9 TaxID=2974299 RepID=UPI0021E10603|nr:hypothetical protein [Thauera sp. Sel9]MCV2216386.1 hypothetical protein [Thauera sp. Sel9]